MNLISITAEPRISGTKGLLRSLRTKGMVPGVYYGKGQKNLQLAVNSRDLEKAVSGELGMNTILRLTVKDHGDFTVLVHDYQADSIKRNFTHVDFRHVDLTKKILVSIPVHLTGKPVGVKEGGILEQVTREVQVLCLPTHIPRGITADVTELKIGHSLHLSQVKLPEGSELHEKTDVTLALVAAQKEEEVAAPTAMVEPEVLTAKKEGEAAAPAAGEEKAGDKKAGGDKKSAGDKKAGDKSAVTPAPEGKGEKKK